ncbi:YbaB/EbfC family nucleoid-associated protein [Actinosynnema sp. NPDC047251]|uniref:YbaB/EbfC family nucleoid-associated protein n=1 Tax=Saccharothrix espanaensis TaxID=103731 RepID=UPI0002E09790|nr:YbaB/EbfC family nucleoid-associated protein [Saccharothrix espanaensis]
MTDPQRPVLPSNLRRMAEDLRRRADRFGELQTRLDRTAATASSPDDAVHVTVDANGVPTAFRFAERFRELDVRAMADQVQATLRRAQARLRDQVTELAAETVGEDVAAEQFLASYRSRFPDPPAAETSTVQVLRFDPEDDDPPRGGSDGPRGMS